MRLTARENAQLALDHIEVLRSHFAFGDLSNPLVADAVNMRLAAAIEAASRIDGPVLESAFGDNSPRIKATRNAIAHRYEFVEQGIIADTIEHELAEFEAGLTAILDA